MSDPRILFVLLLVVVLSSILSNFEYFRFDHKHRFLFDRSIRSANAFRQEVHERGARNLTSPTVSLFSSANVVQVIKACRLLPDEEQNHCIVRAGLVETQYKSEMEAIFQRPSLEVNRSWHSWPGYDFHQASKSRVLAFSLCTPGNGSRSLNSESIVRKKSTFSDMSKLCNVQLEGMKLWGKKQHITFRQVLGERNLDSERAPHWQKVAYAHAFLMLDFDLVFFLDADCLVTQINWDIRAYADGVMPVTSQRLWLFADDTVDWHSTGEFIIRKNTTSLSFLQDWYRLSVPFFNTTVPNAVLRTRQNGIPSDPLGWITKVNSEWDRLPLRRCHSTHVYHEQGCLGQFYASAPRYFQNLALVDSDRLRRMSLHAHPTNPLLHVCCRDRGDQAAQLLACVKQMKAHGAC